MIGLSDKKRVVITGASGFLGSHLLKRLWGDGRYEILALSSRPDQLRELIAAGSGAQAAAADMPEESGSGTGTDALCRSGGSDGSGSIDRINSTDRGGRIGHTAGTENIRYAPRDEILGAGGEDFLEGAVVVNCAYPRNSTGTEVADGLRYIQQVLLAAVRHGAASIINISSQSVYSQKREEAASESAPICLESPYAVGKYAVELTLEALCGGSETAYTNIRMASLIGPSFSQRITNRFVAQALAGNDLRVNAGRQCFGFLDVEDAVSGLCAILGSDSAAWNKAYNLGPAAGYSLTEIADLVCRLSAEYCPKPVACLAAPSDDYLNSSLDISLFSADFGWRPAVSMEESIRRIYEEQKRSL